MDWYIYIYIYMYIYIYGILMGFPWLITIINGGIPTPLWKMMEFVSWDDEIPNWMESHKIHVPNHQTSSGI